MSWKDRATVLQPRNVLSVGDPAPPLIVGEFLKGEAITRLEPGIVHVVDLFSSWCPSCQEAIPELSAMQDKYPAVIFLGISSMEDDVERCRRLIEALGDEVGYRIALEVPDPARNELLPRPSGAITRDWFEAACLPGVPETFIVDAAGRIAWWGYSEEMEPVLDAVVNGKWDIESARDEQQTRYRKEATREQFWTSVDFYPMLVGEGGPSAALAMIDEAFAATPVLKNDRVLRYNRLAALARVGDRQDELLAYANTLADSEEFQVSPGLYAIGATLSDASAGNAELTQRALEIFRQLETMLADPKQAGWMSPYETATLELHVVRGLMNLGRVEEARARVPEAKERMPQAKCHPPFSRKHCRRSMRLCAESRPAENAAGRDTMQMPREYETMRREKSLISEGLRLIRPFWPVAAFATALGTLSGLATAWLLATINQALYADGDITSALMWTFVGLVVLTLGGEIVSDLGNSWIGQQIIASLRKELVAKVVAAPIDQIERYKAHRLLSALGQDVDTISSFSYGFSSLAIALAVTAACIGYLLFLSPVLFLIVAIAIGTGITINRLARKRGAASYDLARTAQDDLYRHYRSIIEGAKELRINRERRRRVHNVALAATIDRIRDTKVKAFRIFMSANAADSALFFAAIGLIIGWQSWFGVERTVVSGFVLVLLYVKGPLDEALSAYSSFVNAQVSFKRIAELSADFANPEPNLASSISVQPIGERPTTSLEEIELRDARYTFPAAEGVKAFSLGPIDLKIRKGEIVFVVGENGSGKTTLIKLLLALYPCQEGSLLLDGRPVTDETRDEYRQLFSTIFFDYFLFDDIMAQPDEIGENASEYLEKLEIAHKVSISEGRFSTTELSSGQRKRLALVQIYLEGRPVIVFDEWAAEQDPTFRRIFYTDILPDLKRQGKTLIVISHDDRYFTTADRILQVSQGAVVEVPKEHIDLHFRSPAGKVAGAGA